MNRRDQIIINHESIRRRDVYHHGKGKIIHILQGGMGFEEGDRERCDLTVWSVDNEDKVKLLKFLLNSNRKTFILFKEKENSMQKSGGVFDKLLFDYFIIRTNVPGIF